jgi:hypothetical protein
LLDGATSHITAESFVRNDPKRPQIEVEYLCSPVIVADKIVGAVVTFQDVSERREIEFALTNARDTALAAARAKASFLASMSHEIRTPLSGVLGTVALLLNTNLDDAQKHLVGNLQKSLAALSETVDDILDFSKIEAGRMALETLEFDLVLLVNDTVELFRAPAIRKSIGLEVRFGSNVPQFVAGDANRLRQILNNFLSNAIKFTSVGEVVLRVTTSDDRILFEVEDSGIGIAEHEQEFLFQPFTQADVSTTRRFGGTGLGLSICREIVELMGGEIGVESEPGRGSRFWCRIALPVVERSAVASPPEKAPALGLAAVPQRVLLADDDEVNRETGEMLLADMGFEVVVVNDGAAAVASALNEPFDLILMDCRMPQLNGFEAAGLLRVKLAEKCPPIIALTALSGDESEKLLTASGMSARIAKPLTREKLAELLGDFAPSSAERQNLDLRADLIQHSLHGIIAPEVLESLIAVEARGNVGFIAEICQIYVQNTTQELRLIEADLDERYVDGVVRRAHRLNGSSAHLGLTELAGLFVKLENSAEEFNWSDASAHFAGIRQQFNLISKKFQEVS